jgi:hypothetical protein
MPYSREIEARGLTMDFGVGLPGAPEGAKDQEMPKNNGRGERNCPVPPALFAFACRSASPSSTREWFPATFPSSQPILSGVPRTLLRIPRIARCAREDKVLRSAERLPSLPGPTPGVLQCECESMSPVMDLGNLAEAQEGDR